MGETRLLLCTVPDRDVAHTIARALVSRKLAACVNIVPSLTSVYRWQGAVETDVELLLLVKTTSSRADDVVEAIPALHPYDVPEVIVLPIEGGHGPYLDWIEGSVVDGAQPPE